MNAAQMAVSEALRDQSGRLQEAKESAATVLDVAYSWLEKRLHGREWAAGTSRWPIALKPLLYSTATGCIRSAMFILSCPSSEHLAQLAA